MEGSAEPGEVPIEVRLEVDAEHLGSVAMPAHALLPSKRICSTCFAARSSAMSTRPKFASS